LTKDKKRITPIKTNKNNPANNMHEKRSRFLNDKVILLLNKKIIKRSKEKATDLIFYFDT
jgi:hypothetical protein